MSATPESPSELIDQGTTVAAFDFDGTLSRRDNLVPFLRQVAGVRRTNMALLRASGALAIGRRDVAKAALVHGCVAGLDAGAVSQTGVSFADSVVEHHMRVDVVARARWHVERGHRLVIVSASLHAFLDPVARRLERDGLRSVGVVATDIEVGPDGRCTGQLVGSNVRGSEKVRRLEAWMADSGVENAVVWAYGNSGGDAALLARADYPTRVGRRRIVTPPESTNP